MKEYLSIERLWWLLRADFVGGYRSLLTVSGALAGVILITSLVLIAGTDEASRFFLSWFAAMLFLWGAIASSRAFRELHDKTRNEAYLLIPASTVEKTVARLLGVTIGFSVYLLVFTSVISLVVEASHRLLFGAGVGLFNPLDPQVGRLIAAYFFVQSFYFLGAAWFRKSHFIKTTLFINLAVIVFGLIVLLTLRIVFAPEGLSDLGNLSAGVIQSYDGLLDSLNALVKFFALLLPAACWIIAWLRVRETQVSDGV